MPDTVTVICALVLTVGCASLGRSFLMACEGNNYDRAFWLKGAAGLCFVALGLLMARDAVQRDYAWRVSRGQCPCQGQREAGRALTAQRLSFRYRAGQTAPC